MVNRPERYEAYVLEPDQTKVSYKIDTKSTNSGCYTILKEDHTVGNVMRFELLKDKRILFAGYKVPHPLLYQLQIKVKTDGSCTPQTAMIDAVKNSIKTLDILEDKFKKAIQTRKNLFNTPYY